MKKSYKAFAVCFLLAVSQCFSQSSADSELKLSSFQYIKRFNYVFDQILQNYVEKINILILKYRIRRDKTHMKKKKTYKILFLLILFGYIIYIFINQQQILNAYKSDEKRYALQIEEAKTKNSNLIAKKENVNSKEFIEEIARDKLDMYLPNERVYIDIGK